MCRCRPSPPQRAPRQGEAVDAAQPRAGLARPRGARAGVVLWLLRIAQVSAVPAVLKGAAPATKAESPKPVTKVVIPERKRSLQDFSILKSIGEGSYSTVRRTPRCNMRMRR